MPVVPPFADVVCGVVLGDVCVVEPVGAEDDSVEVDGDTAAAAVVVDEFVVVDGVVESVGTVVFTGVVVTVTSVVVAGVPRQ